MRVFKHVSHDSVRSSALGNGLAPEPYCRPLSFDYIPIVVSYEHVFLLSCKPFFTPDEDAV